MLRRLALGLGLALGLSTGAGAVDYVAGTGPLSDADFYRLVSCGAPPGGACQSRPIAWPAPERRDLRVALEGRDAGFPAWLGRVVAGAVIHAVQEINGAGADLRLRLVPAGSDADIRIYLRDIPYGGTITGTGLSALDGTPLQIARFSLNWSLDREIRRGVILISRDLRADEAHSVLLEELVQSMGLRWDIRDPAYRGRSIFDEDSNLVRRLSGQDRTALRMHYGTRR